MAYLLVATFVVLAGILFRLAFDLPQDLVQSGIHAFAAIVGVAVTRWFDRRAERKPADRRGWYLLTLPLFGGLLVVQIWRLFQGFAQGRLLVSLSNDGAAYAVWTDRPAAFLGALLLHLAITLFVAAMLFAAAYEVRNWWRERVR